MRVTAILLAAGQGKRFRSGVAKPLVKLGRSRLIEHSLKVLDRHPGITDIILAVNSGNIKSIDHLVKKSGSRKVRALVLGGARRQDSVFNALKSISPQSRLVLIHDSARPFVRSGEISRLIARAARTGAAILGVPVKATIKKVTSGFLVEKTLDRNLLWEIQTPQVFRKDLLLEAYRRFKNVDVTDDAAMVEKLNKRVEIVLGSYDNIKITTPEDLTIAKTLLKTRACQSANRGI